MLSVLIPVFQYDVRKLVNDLHQQCSDAGINFEIICMDDGSDTHFDQINRSITQLSFVHYLRNGQNSGRSFTRNALSRAAKFEFLLYLDCDASITNKNFIRNYLPLLHKNKLISGGRTYDENPPANKDYRLHWNWGVKRELLDAKMRMRDPVNHFLSNNFVIAREVILRFPFDEQIRKYGYEDVYFAYQLSQNGVEILHIENPVIHEGLDKKEELLRKLDEASDNILMLYRESNNGNRPFIIKSRLIQVWLIFNKPVLSQIMRLLSYIMRPTVRYYLLHINPSIFLLDMYRLMGLFTSKN